MGTGKQVGASGSAGHLEAQVRPAGAPPGNTTPEASRKTDYKYSTDNFTKLGQTISKFLLSFGLQKLNGKTKGVCKNRYEFKHEDVLLLFSLYRLDWLSSGGSGFARPGGPNHKGWAPTYYFDKFSFKSAGK